MELSSRIEKYWDERSENFSKSRRIEFDGVDGLAWQKIFKKNLPKSEKALKILDVGTGAGFFAAILSKMGHKVVGVDMSSKMLAEAQKNLHELKLHAEFHKMNAQNLNFADEMFDVVVTRNLTWTLPDVKAAYREWHRVLKISGVLMNFDSDYGDKNFFDEKTCARGEVCNKMLNECYQIKNSVEISRFRRPKWDKTFLESLNFSVRLEEDISQAVHHDKRCIYDSVPLFSIHATK